MNRRFRQGITLTEALLAGTLALVLGVLMVRLISSGLSAHSKGSQTRDAQAGVRNVVSLLVSELRSAAVPPLAEPLVVTPVFWPGVWGAAQEISPTDLFYVRETTALEGDLEQDLASNRLVYVRASDSLAETASNPLEQFALVELFVPKDRPNVIERRIHSLTSLHAALEKRPVEGADGAQRSAWLLNLSALDAVEPPSEPDIMYDAGSDARVAFRVSHRSFEPVSDPGRTRYPQLFDPGVFKLEVAVAVGAADDEAATTSWPEPQAWSTLREETTELRIPGVRQN